MVKTLTLIGFLLKIKLTNFFSENKNPEELFVNILFFVLLMVNAIGTHYLLNFFYQQNLDDVPEILTRSTLVAFFSIPICLIFIPSFKRKVQFFNNLDPVTYCERSIIEIICNLLSFPYLALICSLYFLVYLSPYLGSIFLLYGGLYIVASSICCLLIQHIFCIGFSTVVRVLNISMIALILYITFTIFGDSLLISGLVIAVLITNYVSLQRKEPIPAFRSYPTERSDSNLSMILIKIFIRTFTIRVNLFLAFCLKTIFLIMFLSKPSMTNHYFIMLIGSSLILFTYIYNNVWGYLRTTFNTLALKRDLRVLFNAYISILFVPIIIDVILSTSLWLFFKKPLGEFVLVYISTLVCNIMIGFYSSIVERFEVVKAINLSGFKSNTPLVFNLLSVFIVLLVIIGYPVLGLIETATLSILIALYSYYRLILKKIMERSQRNIYAMFDK